jgi:hypothetical protein
MVARSSLTDDAGLHFGGDTSHYDKAGKAIPEVPVARLSKWWNTHGA